MSFSHVYGSCWTVCNGFAIFCRGFYSITATQFMFGIWWPPMCAYLYHSLCVYLFSFMVYFISWCLFIFIYFHLCSLISIYFHFSFLFSFLFIFSFLLFFLSWKNHYQSKPLACRPTTLFCWQEEPQEEPGPVLDSVDGDALIPYDGKSNPPVQFCKEHGFSKGCKACNPFALILSTPQIINTSGIVFFIRGVFIIRVRSFPLILN